MTFPRFSKRTAIIIGVIIGLVISVIIILTFSHTNKSSVEIQSPVSRGTYVALGDSVAAGVGLPTGSDASACYRTNEAYPYSVAKAMNYKLHSLACSGATLPNGILGVQNVNHLDVAAQLDQLFTQPKPELITITIGANDVKWSAILAKCYTGNCGTAADTQSVNADLQNVSTNYALLLTKIQEHYKTSLPRVIVTGYHQVFPVQKTNNCGVLNNIDDTELAWGRQLQTNINETVRSSVANFPFATFVPIDFSGHELCTNDSWVQDFTAKQPYHPTEAGQVAFSKAIIDTLTKKQ